MLVEHMIIECCYRSYLPGLYLTALLNISNHPYGLVESNNAFSKIILYWYWSNLVHEYRDRIYIRKDILLKLYEYGELNQSKLMSYCGLNNVKHKVILDDMVKKEMIIRTEERWGNKNIIKYKVSEKGNDILREILEPYESLFPRTEREKQSWF